MFQGINIKKKNLASESLTLSGSLVLVVVTRWLVGADIVKD